MSKYILEEYEPEKEQKVKVKVSNEKYSSKVRLLKRKTVEKKSDNYHILGYLKNRNKVKEIKDSMDVIEIDSHNYPLLSKKATNHKIIGYIKVGENDFISVTKSRIMTFLIPIFILIALIIAYLYHNNVVDVPVIAETVSQPKENISTEVETVDFAGFSSLYTFSEGDNFYISNPDGNTVYDEFTITDTKGNELYKSDLVPPGEYVAIDPYEVFKENITINIHIKTYDKDSYDNNKSLVECSPMNYSNIDIVLKNADIVLK